MNNIIPFKKSKNQLWATAFYIQGKRYVTNIYASKQQAISDRLWREEQVKAYKHLLLNNNKSIPQYCIITIHRSELPKNWKPLPALGFLLKS